MKKIFNSSPFYSFVVITALVFFGSCSDDVMLPAPEPVFADYTCTCTLDFVDDSIEDTAVSAQYTDVEISDALEACETADTIGNNELDSSIASYSCVLTSG